MDIDSPLRHHAYNNGFRESDDFLKPLFFCAFLFLPRYSPVLWAAYTLIIYSLKIHPSNTGEASWSISVMIAPAETSVLIVILATYERNSMPAGAPFNERSSSSFAPLFPLSPTIKILADAPFGGLLKWVLRGCLSHMAASDPGIQSGMNGKNQWKNGKIRRLSDVR